MLFKKCLRDIKLNKSQFLNIFIMVFLGIFVFAGIHSYMDGMRTSGERFYENNNLADLWLSGENFSKDDLEDIKNIDNVNNAERTLTLKTELLDYNDVVLEANFIESNNICKMYVQEGEAFDKNKKGVWLDSYLAKNLGINLGDEITFKYEKYEMKEKVVGLVYTPDHIYNVKDQTAIFPNHKDFGFIYLSINEFPDQLIYDKIRDKMKDENPYLKNVDITNKMIEENIKDFDISDYYVFTNVLVDLKDTSKIEDTKRKIENEIESVLAVTDREANASYVTLNSEIEEGNTYSSVFTLLFLFIAMLSVITTMNRFVKKQRVQIGTLKALGIKKRKITMHYVGYGFVISLLASAVGLVLGNTIIGNFFMNMEMEYFEIPAYSTIILPIVYELSIAVILIVTFVTYLSCRSILKEPAVEALRVEIPKVKNTKFDLTTKGVFKKASISTKWNIRDICRNKGRSFMAIVGVIGCTMLLVCAFGMLDTMNSYLEWEFDVLNDFKYKVSLSNEYSNSDLDSLKEKYGDATSATVGIEVQINDKKEANTLVVNDAADYLKYTNHEKKYINLSDDGIYLTEKLADKWNIKVGDEIKFHLFGDEEWYTCKVVGLNRDPQNQNLNITRKCYENLGLEYKPDSLYTNDDLSNAKNLDGVNTIQSIENLKDGIQSMLKTVKTMVCLLVVVSGILSAVIIYNLGILSFSEKQYQFATLKVLGFKDKQIRKIFVKQNLWLSVIGIIIGLPLGSIMIKYIFEAALGDNYDFVAIVKTMSYIYAAVGSYIVSVIVNKLLAKKVKNIDMVTSLKGNE